MISRRHQTQAVFVLLPIAAAVILAACGGNSDAGSDSSVAPLTVPKVASCASGSTPETGLQGQVPAAMRATGFKGFNCNLSLVGQSQNEGGNWSSASFTDGAGRSCAYHASAVPNSDRKNPGVPVIDITDRTKPLRVTSLTTPAMTDPWESLRVSTRRQILLPTTGKTVPADPKWTSMTFRAIAVLRS